MNRKMIWNDGLDSWTEEELLCMKYLNVCYGKGGGSAPPPPPSSVQQSTTAEFPTELRPFISDIFEKGQAIQEQRQEEGFQPELTQQLASFTPEQEASFQGIQNVVGQSQPLFNEATTLARQSGRAATDPAEVAALMNPFLRNVTDIQKREAQRVGDVQEQQLAAQASQAGAFGGSRAAILEAERQRNLSQQLGDIEAQGLAASFQNAQNQLQNQFGRESASAAQLGALGAAIPAQQFKEFGALSGIGAAKQQQAQRAFDIATQQAREEYGFPMATLQDFSSILRGFPLPATQNVSKQSFSPAQPLSTQLLGLGTGLAGLAGAAGAFKKAGGLVGAPVGMKNGGYVKLAGGGGLGQMMQEKLPSNRVRMGKTAYQDVTVPIPYEPNFADTQKMIDILLKEGGAKGLSILKRMGYRNEAIAFALGEYQRELPVTGEIATAAAEKASVPDSAAAIPVADPSVFKNPNDLSFLQKAFGVADDIAQGMPTGRPTAPVDVALGQSAPAIPAPKMATKIDSRVPFIQASLNSDGTVAAPPLLSAAPAAVPALPVGGSTDSATVPVNMAGMDPTAAAAIPEAGLLQRLQESYPLKIDAPTTQYTPPPPTLPDILAPKDDSMGIYERRARENEMSMKGPVYPDPLLRQSKPLQSIGFDDVSGQQIDLSDPAVRQRMSERSLSQSFLNPTAVNPLDVEEQKVEDFQRNEALKARQLLSEQQSGGGGEFSGLKTPEELAAQNASSVSIDPIQSGDLTDTATTINNAPIKRQSTEPAAPTTAAPTAAGTVNDPLAGPFLDEELDKGRPSPGATPAQIDYNAKIAEFNNKDYSKEVQAALGPAPTYEKGEEPDFASQKYLTLLGVSARILSSNKPALQALGDAVQPAIKELADLGKEERKIQRELRTERNTQKRMDYQDKAGRLKMQRDLRGDDIDAMKTVAEIGHRQDQLKISRTNADSARATAMANAGFQRLKTDTLIFDNFMTQKGYRTLDEVRKELDGYKQSFIKSQLAIAKASAMPYSADKVISEANKMYAAEVPNLINRANGNTMKTDDNGNVIPYTREELVQRLAPLGATPTGGGGGRTLQRPDGSSVIVKS